VKLYVGNVPYQATDEDLRNVFTLAGVALDSVNAGVGDRVLLVQDGYAASTALGLKLAPIDAAVIGIVDRVELASEDLGPTGAAAPAKKRPKKQQAQ